MKKRISMGLLLLGVCLVPLSVVAADFDGSKPLLFSVISVMECTPDEGCNQVTAESVMLPQFFKIDFKTKRVTPAMEAQGKRTSEIKRMERIDGKVILQGAEAGIEGGRGGLGWTLAISEETGRAILTASGEEVGFVVFGACIPF
ncbi:MAG TPA: hypothetical protein VEI04_00795 [Syntrophobacteria bacterium]|nr:hypothetical protein [Syntrophobacteria bacterium]